MLRHLLSLVGCGGLLPPTLPSGFAFLFKLAWQSKVRLPLLIALAFMLTDYHLQLEINVDIQVREEPLPVNDAEGDLVNANDGVAEVDILFEGIIAEDFEEEDDESEGNSSFESDDDYGLMVDAFFADLESRFESFSEVDDAAQER
ncbi:hypothetical protein FHG87_014269 [Trinorchestia longiramus]|nr:hypothetical protein FHG87_014269 [Trinorchestia longiramus]